MPIKSSHSFAGVGAVVDGLQVDGFWDDDNSVEIAPINDEGELYIGPDGSAIFNATVENAKTVKLMLQPNSPTHVQLQQKLSRQKLGVPLPFPVSAFNLNAGENGNGNNSYIMSQPSQGYGKNATVREWTLVVCDWRDV